MKPSLFLLSGCLLFFAGCGEIEIPQTIPSPSAVATPAPIITPAIQSPGAEGVSPSPSVSPLISGAPQSCEAVLAEKNNLTEAVRVAQTELRDCQIQKNRFEALVKNQDASNTESGILSPTSKIVRESLASVPQKEFPFDVCGPIGNATAKGWYAEFTKALESKNISFQELNRPLKASDFSRVCASSDGKMAVFLGAQSDKKTEFHMIKYEFESKNISDAYLLDGLCQEACPDNFGKRRGGVITLSGKVGNVTAEYEYYYDKNVLLKKKVCRGSQCENF